MEYKTQELSHTGIHPRLIIHGGAGNIKPATLPPEKYGAYRDALLSIVAKVSAYMHEATKSTQLQPSSLDTATFAVTLLEDHPLFNAGHGAVFTRDGINELEASVMVSRGHAKRGVGVMGLRHVRNPILLAKTLLQHGDADLGVVETEHGTANARHDTPREDAKLDVPTAQGHTQIFGEAAEILAQRYGLDMVDPQYFFTQARWDEHVRALEREREGKGLGTWSADEYLPQGTVGAIALDGQGVICCATSTGGLTNKLTGRIGDTPVIGAGFWAEEWVDQVDSASPTQPASRQARIFKTMAEHSSRPGPLLTISGTLGGLLADCLPTPFTYTPVYDRRRRNLETTRSMAVSGTGNGDSFLRIAAARTVGSIARFASLPTSVALSRVSGPSGELQKSAGSRWGRTGEGEGGMIGIECIIIKDEQGRVLSTRSEIVQDFNCAGMFRAWVDDDGRPRVAVWRDDSS